MLAKHTNVQIEGKWTLQRKDPFECDTSSIKRHLQGRSSPRGPLGVYACNALLRAMAAVKNVHLVVIDKRLLQDKCSVYPPGVSTKTQVSLSWAEEVVPKLLRQQEAGSSSAASPRYVVILWNGHADASGHFDATMSSD